MKWSYLKKQTYGLYLPFWRHSFILQANKPSSNTHDALQVKLKDKNLIFGSENKRYITLQVQLLEQLCESVDSKGDSQKKNWYYIL